MGKLNVMRWSKKEPASITVVLFLAPFQFIAGLAAFTVFFWIEIYRICARSSHSTRRS